MQYLFNICTAAQMTVNRYIYTFERFRKKDVQVPSDVHISVYKDHLAHGFQEKPPIASVVAQRWYLAPGVQRVDVMEKGLKGTLFIPPGTTLICSEVKI